MQRAVIGLLLFGAGALTAHFATSSGGDAPGPRDDAPADGGRTADAGGGERPHLEDFKQMPGRFRPVQENGVEATDGDVEALGDLGYAGGYEPSGDKSGVIYYAPDHAWAGLNLFHDGSGPTASVTDMEGNVLHQWRYALSDLVDIETIHEVADTMARFPDKFGYWRRVHAFPNGDLLAIFADVALIKLDRDSNLIWSWRGGVHHDLWVDPDNGEIFVLTRKIKVIPRFSPNRQSAEDFVTVISPDGELLREYSILEGMMQSNFASLQHLSPRGGDLQHTNTIEVLDGRLADRSPAFRKGNVLLSLCRIDTIAILDPRSEKIVWSMAGPWHRQHQPTVLDNGNMLIFDNRGHGGNSKVIEFDPFSQELFWGYRHSPTTPFSSETCGSNQRLENGNTLIVETDTGRAFEVKRDGKIAWEFYTPNRAGENGDLIATLFDCIRLPEDYFADWLSE